MRIKSLLFTFILFVVSSSIFADGIEPSKAEQVAINFFYDVSNQFDRSISVSELDIAEAYIVNDAYYVINFQEGWVIVSANDAMTPVIGYNFTGQFPATDQLGENLKSWMHYFVDQANFIEENNLAAEPTVQAEWEKYLSDEAVVTSARGDRGEVDPLLTSRWNQDNPYNVLCPEDAAGPGGHVYVGCVATAMVQIMNYWRYPNQGSGTYSYYKYPYGTQSVNYGEATYEWDAMQDNIDNNNPWEIAEVGYHAAVSVRMDFSPSGSGAYSWDVPDAMEDHFNYSTSAQYVEKSSYSFTNWESMIQEELENSHPMYYSGYSSEGGHAFVLDGYQGSNYYHFNFGWSGSGDGYYTLQDVNSFSGGQGLVKGIIPDDPDYPYIASGAQTLTQFSGSFTDGSGPVEDYPYGMDASWLIDPQTEMDSVESITLSFTDFNTASNDMVKVYAGSTTNDELIGEFSGNELPGSISIDGNQMLITFSSTGTGSGFKAEYNTTLATWCNGSNTYTEPYGTISDGSGDFFYTNQSTCVYIIQHNEAVNITLEFTDFATEADMDFVQVYDQSQQLVEEFSGMELPDAVSVEGNTMIIVWSTNATIREQGWTANYYIDGVGYEENIYENLAVYPNPTSGKLNVQFDMEAANNLEVRVVNLSGQVVRTETKSNFNGRYSSSLNISDLPKGIYLLSLISEKGKLDRKIVLK